MARVKYIAPYKGYVSDVPLVWIKRCDGKIFHFDELTRSSVAPQTKFLDINCGWDKFPVAQISQKKSITISLTSAKFDTSLFELNECGNTDSNYTDFMFKEGIVKKAVHLIYLDDLYEDIVESSIDIYGKMLVNKIPANEQEFRLIRFEDGHGAIELYYDRTLESLPVLDIGHLDVFELDAEYDYEEYYKVSYEARRSKSSGIQSKLVTAVTGECVLKYPVYKSGNDCSESNIKGFVIIKIYKAYIKERAGFDSSYKSAHQFRISLEALEAGRKDGSNYAIAFVDND